MESSSPPTSPDWTSLVRSIVLFALNAILVLVVLSWVFDDFTQFGGLAGESVLMRIIPALALASASLGGALAYMTMGLVAPERVRLFRGVSGVFALVALALLLVRAFGPVLGVA
jgi:hypothetical protein